MGILAGALMALALITGLLGLWGPMLDVALLKGPLRSLVAPLVFGGFAVSAGGILAAGAPITEAIRLAIKTSRSQTAQRELTGTLRAVRQGQTLSDALAKVNGFPNSIVRLAMIGERSGALGQMLVRAGRFEEQTAFRRIEKIGRIVGPVMIITLGGIIGLMMAGLLSGVSGLGEAALG